MPLKLLARNDPRSRHQACALTVAHQHYGLAGRAARGTASAAARRTDPLGCRRLLYPILDLNRGIDDSFTAASLHRATSTTRGADANQSLSSPILWPTSRRCSLLSRRASTSSTLKRTNPCRCRETPFAPPPSHHADRSTLPLVTSSDVRRNNCHQPTPARAQLLGLFGALRAPQVDRACSE